MSSVRPDCKIRTTTRLRDDEGTGIAIAAYMFRGPVPARVGVRIETANRRYALCIRLDAHEARRVRDAIDAAIAVIDPPKEGLP